MLSSKDEPDMFLLYNVKLDFKSSFGTCELERDGVEVFIFQLKTEWSGFVASAAVESTTPISFINSDTVVEVFMGYNAVIDNRGALRSDTSEIIAYMIASI